MIWKREVHFESLGLDLGKAWGSISRVWGFILEFWDRFRGSVSRVRSFIWERFRGQFREFGASFGRGLGVDFEI